MNFQNQLRTSLIEYFILGVNNFFFFGFILFKHNTKFYLNFSYIHFKMLSIFFIGTQ